jgi:zinc protease
MVNSFIARKDLDTEMTVVRNEMEMGENNPGRILMQRTLAAMYDWHNYGKSTIGARTDVENVDIPRLQAFYQAALPARQRDADRHRQVRRGAGAGSGWQPASASCPKPTRTLPAHLHAGPAAGRRAQVATCGAAAARHSLLAAYHVPAGLRPRLRRGGDAGADARRHAGRAGCTSAWSSAKLAASTFAFAWRWPSPGPLMLGAAAGAGAGRGQGARRRLGVASRSPEPVTRRGTGARAHAVAQRLGAGLQRPRARGRALSEAIAQRRLALYFLARDRCAHSRWPTCSAWAEAA